MHFKKPFFFILIFLLLVVFLYFLPKFSKTKTENPLKLLASLDTATESGKDGGVLPMEGMDKNFVKLAWFYKPPEDGTSLYFLAENYDTFILTHYDEEERDTLKTLGVEQPFFEYLLFVQIQDPGSCNKEPYGNQVAYKAGDFCRIRDEHPEWFLRNKNGEIVRKGKNVFMDPGNLEYRAFWLERAKEMRESFGWDGIFIDNVEASLNRYRRMKEMPVQYPDDESYQKEIEAFLAEIQAQYFEPQGVPVYANITEYEDTEVWLRYLNYFDGVMIEDFAVDYNNRYYSEWYWEEQQNMIREAQAGNKALILVAQGEKDDTERAQFSLVSYLLAAQGRASFRYTGSDYYEEVWFYDNYQLDLGMPMGDAYRVDGGWKKDFENGYVFLNPARYTSEIHIE